MPLPLLRTGPRNAAEAGPEGDTRGLRKVRLSGGAGVVTPLAARNTLGVALGAPFSPSGAGLVRAWTLGPVYHRI